MRPLLGCSHEAFRLRGIIKKRRPAMKSKSTIGDIWDGIFGQWKKKAPVVEPAPLLLRICEKCGQVYQDGLFV
jgi:hypothetical protein